MDNYWPEVVTNLRKTRKKGLQLSRIMGREGTGALMLGLFYKAMVKAVLLFDSEIWVVTPCIIWTMGVFRYRVACHLAGNKYWR